MLIYKLFTSLRTSRCSLAFVFDVLEYALHDYVFNISGVDFYALCEEITILIIQVHSVFLFTSDLKC